jgi:orotate phosphoribosyltransferase-like protein
MGEAMATAKEPSEKAKTRWKLTLQLRAMGKTYKEIGESLGISTARARGLFMRAQYESHKERKQKLYTDWRVEYDYRILTPIIDQIRGLTGK